MVPPPKTDREGDEDPDSSFAAPSKPPPVFPRQPRGVSLPRTQRTSWISDVLCYSGVPETWFHWTFRSLTIASKATPPLSTGSRAWTAWIAKWQAPYQFMGLVVAYPGRNSPPLVAGIEWDITEWPVPFGFKTHALCYGKRAPYTGYWFKIYTGTTQSPDESWYIDYLST